MGIETKSTATLSALLFCLGASHAAKAEVAPKIESLKVMSEEKVNYEQFEQMTQSSSDGIESSFISSGNYASFVSSGNYADFISSGNYANFISSGNYANFISSGNYGSAPTEEQLRAIPSPQVAK